MTTTAPTRRGLDFYAAAFVTAASFLARDTGASVRAAINAACGAPDGADEETALRIFAELYAIPAESDRSVGEAVDAWQGSPDTVRGGHSSYHCLYFADHWLESVRFLLAQGQPQPTPLITEMAAAETASLATEVQAA